MGEKQEPTEKKKKEKKSASDPGLARKWQSTLRERGIERHPHIDVDSGRAKGPPVDPALQAKRNERGFVRVREDLRNAVELSRTYFLRVQP